MIATQDRDIVSAAAMLGVDPREVLDFSSNVYPRGVTPAVRQAIHDSAERLEQYPDPAAKSVCKRVGELFNVPPGAVRAGADTLEFIYAVPRALRPRRVVIVAPCSHDYWRATDYAGGEAEGVLASEAAEFVPDMSQVEMRLSGVDMVFLGNPNNPTGVALPADAIRTLARRFPHATFVVDEAYVEFVAESVSASLLPGDVPENVLVLRSMGPFHGLAGLRVGFMVGSPELCAIVDRAREVGGLNVPMLMAAEALLDEVRDMGALRAPIIAERERVRDELSRLAGIRVFRSQANFLLLKITRPTLSSAQLCERLLRQKILIRNAAGFRGLDAKYVRLSIRTTPDNDRLIEAMKKALDEGEWG